MPNPPKVDEQPVKTKKELEHEEAINIYLQERELAKRNFPSADGHSRMPEALIKGQYSIAEIESFKERNKGNLTPAENYYLNRRIEKQKQFSELRKKLADNEVNKTTPNVITDEKGFTTLEGIHQDRWQSTGNGCYSCSMKLLLQSRGLNLSQEDVRDYRPEGGFRNDLNSDAMTFDKPTDLLAFSESATDLLPNAGVASTTLHIKSYSPEMLKKISDTAWNIIKHSIVDCKSPVAFLRDFHYRTIVGFKEGPDGSRKVILKDSNNRSELPDTNHEFDLMNLLVGTTQLSFLHLTDIDFEKQNPLDQYSPYGVNMTYRDGAFQDISRISIPVANDPFTMGKEWPGEGSRTMISNTSSYANEALTVQTDIALPNQLKASPAQLEMLSNQTTANTKAVHDDLLKKIDAEIAKLVPPGTNLSFAIEEDKLVCRKRSEDLGILKGNDLLRLVYLQNIKQKSAAFPDAICKICLSDEFYKNQMNDQKDTYVRYLADLSGLTVQVEDLYVSCAEAHEKSGPLKDEHIEKMNMAALKQRLVKEMQDFVDDQNSHLLDDNKHTVSHELVVAKLKFAIEERAHLAEKSNYQLEKMRKELQKELANTQKNLNNPTDQYTQDLIEEFNNVTTTLASRVTVEQDVNPAGPSL